MDRANAIAAAAAEAEEAFRAGKMVASPISIPSGATWKPVNETLEHKPSVIPQIYHTQDGDPGGELDDIVDVEHLQLTPQEAFFLIWCFDCLSVLNPYTVRCDVCRDIPPYRLTCMHIIRARGCHSRRSGSRFKDVTWTEGVWTPGHPFFGCDLITRSS